MSNETKQTMLDAFDGLATLCKILKGKRALTQQEKDEIDAIGDLGASAAWAIKDNECPSCGDPTNPPPE